MVKETNLYPSYLYRYRASDSYTETPQVIRDNWIKLWMGMPGGVSVEGYIMGTNTCIKAVRPTRGSSSFCYVLIKM